MEALAKGLIFISIWVIGSIIGTWLAIKGQ